MPKAFPKIVPAAKLVTVTSPPAMMPLVKPAMAPELLTVLPALTEMPELGLPVPVTDAPA